MSMPYDEKAFERNFVADLRKRIICAADDDICTTTSCNDEQASSSTVRKRPFSDTLDASSSTSDDVHKTNNQYMRPQIKRGGDDCSLRLDDISTERIGASASLLETGVAVAVKSPMALFDEFADLVYRSMDDDMKRQRNPFDDLAEGIYRDIDFPVSSEDNLLDSFVKSAYIGRMRMKRPFLKMKARMKVSGF
mmetsp:Transcript_17679/g.27519  ORF Transcript_17679/g.27519 Transcript_17679/m.27519 type:complete len:193 (+) Transcript_17679:24-602(+)